MSESKFPKLINYDALKREFSDDQKTDAKQFQESTQEESPLIFNHAAQKTNNNQKNNCEVDDHESNEVKPSGLTGTRLRSYAFAVLTRKEYSKKDLIEKLCLYAQNRNEVLELVEELARENYQSDKRVAEMTVRSQIRKGKGPNRIKLALKAKSIDKELAKDDIAEVDWYEEAYQLKVKKYGTEVATDPKLKAKQIRFLQYRGFEMDAIMKAIKRKNDEE